MRRAILLLMLAGCGPEVDRTECCECLSTGYGFGGTCVGLIEDRDEAYAACMADEEEPFPACINDEAAAVREDIAVCRDACAEVYPQTE